MHHRYLKLSRPYHDCIISLLPIKSSLLLCPLAQVMKSPFTQYVNKPQESRCKPSRGVNLRVILGSSFIVSDTPTPKSSYHQVWVIFSIKSFLGCACNDQNCPKMTLVAQRPCLDSEPSGTRGSFSFRRRGRTQAPLPTAKRFFLSKKVNCIISWDQAF